MSQSQPVGMPKSQLTGVLAQKLPKTTRVKNKTPAPVQITAEQILREAKDRQDPDFKPPRQKITDEEELADYRLNKRKTFEDNIRKNRTLMANWVKYAAWEESQKDFARARSVFERAIDVDYRNSTVWLRYAEMEMKNKFINHARNIWDRAVTLLPRVDQLWYKYAHMEEMLGNVTGSRQIFERWMQWNPDDHAWTSYVKLELRYGEVEHARRIMERYIANHNTVKAWLKYAKFEERLMERDRARRVFERAVEGLGETCEDEDLFITFAKFEERCKEVERARTIYKYAMSKVPKAKAATLYKEYIQFEKMHGERESVEGIILSKRRFQYEEELKVNSKNYDVWFDYIRLEESNGDRARIEEVYERAIANVPPASEKRLWYRYVYIWINYALYEELDAADAEKTREVYKACIKLIPHKAFSFSKIWLMYAHFEVRQKNLQAARQVLGAAVGMAPKEKIFRGYIQLELQLGEIERCRALYEKWLQYAPSNCAAWAKFADLEKTVGEHERARAIFELAIQQPALDMPEVIWKAYIDFEIALRDHGRTRRLYERLLERTKHVKVWISYAQFEAGPAEEAEMAREVFRRADAFLAKQPDQKEERVLLLEKWTEFEADKGDKLSQDEVRSKLPKRIKKRREITADDGSSGGWEEYYDYVFPDEAAARPNLKILEMAHKWKKQKVAGQE
eukprot:tig00000128_g7203.t1